MSLTTDLKKPVTFATADLRIFEKDAPNICPLCGWPVIKGIYNCECSNFDGCDWFAEYQDEEQPEAPDRYDWVLNK